MPCCWQPSQQGDWGAIHCRPWRQLQPCFTQRNAPVQHVAAVSWAFLRIRTDLVWCDVSATHSTHGLASINLQFVREFAKLGLTKSVGGVLGLALSRELTPVVTCIIIAGAFK